MTERLEQLNHRYEELSVQLSAPETYNDPALAARLNREQRELEPVVQAWRDLAASERELADAEALLHDEDEALRICAREHEGENLIVNRLAIPHCWSEQERRFRGFFITLAHPILVNNEPVSHVLIACAAAEARHELKIFSYLSSVLSSHPAETIARLKDYNAFIALLRQ